VLTLTAGDVRVDIEPERGGRLLRAAVGDLELLLTPDDDPGGMHWGSFPMAPWAGRTREAHFTFAGVEHALPVNSGHHAIHGTVRDRPWIVEEATAAQARLSCSFGAGWPFDGWAEQLVTVHDDRIDQQLSVHSSDGPMPASCGWHPWFRRQLARGGPARLTLGMRSMYERDDDFIATRTLLTPPPAGPWDDCFTDADKPTKLTWPKAATLTIETSCPDLVVYTMPEAAICIEPQTAPPDALNVDPFVVEPERPLVATMSWRLKLSR
jgi:aldose 1-epimerase